MGKVNINTLVEELQGSCGTLQGACETQGFDYDDLTADDCLQIDNEIFECTTCGWWCEVCEMSEDQDGQVCVDCNND